MRYDRGATPTYIRLPIREGSPWSTLRHGQGTRVPDLRPVPILPRAIAMSIAVLVLSGCGPAERNVDDFDAGRDIPECPVSIGAVESEYAQLWRITENQCQYEVRDAATSVIFAEGSCNWGTAGVRMLSRGAVAAGILLEEVPETDVPPERATPVFKLSCSELTDNFDTLENLSLPLRAPDHPDHVDTRVRCYAHAQRPGVGSMVSCGGLAEHWSEEDGHASLTISSLEPVCRWKDTVHYQVHGRYHAWCLAGGPVTIDVSF